MPGPGRRDDKNTNKQQEVRKGPGSSGAGKGPDKNSGGGIPPGKKP